MGGQAWVGMPDALLLAASRLGASVLSPTRLLPARYEASDSEAQAGHTKKHVAGSGSSLNIIERTCFAALKLKGSALSSKRLLSARYQESDSEAQAGDTMRQVLRMYSVCNRTWRI